MTARPASESAQNVSGHCGLLRLKGRQHRLVYRLQVVSDCTCSHVVAQSPEHLRRSAAEISASAYRPAMLSRCSGILPHRPCAAAAALSDLAMPAARAASLLSLRSAPVAALLLLRALSLCHVLRRLFLLQGCCRLKPVGAVVQPVVVLLRMDQLLCVHFILACGTCGVLLMQFAGGHPARRRDPYLDLR